MQNVLTVDFSNPSEAAYRESFYRLLCGIKDTAPGRDVKLPAPIKIPEPISSDPKRAEAKPLSGGEQAAIKQMLLSTNNMQLLLAQKGVDRTLMHQAVLKPGERLFGANNCLHASPLTSQNADSAKYFTAFGRSLKLDKPTPDAEEFRYALEDKVRKCNSRNNPMLLLLTRFDDGPDAPRKELANVLRTLCEETDTKLRVIFCGGQKLAALRYLPATLSPLMNAEVTFWPETTTADLKLRYPHLDEPTCDRLLAVTGRHPTLLRAAIERYEPANPDKLKNDLLDYMCRNGFFIPYLGQREQLLPMLQGQHIAAHNYWPSDPLVRDLFWENLLTSKDNHFIWRCPLVQQCGLKVVGQ